MPANHLYNHQIKDYQSKYFREQKEGWQMNVGRILGEERKGERWLKYKREKEEERRDEKEIDW